MIVEPVKSSLTTGFASQGYRIGDRALLESALSTLMYKDPHLAVVRELLTNARDSHREAGTPDVPVEIDFPTASSPDLVIRDFGVGINHSRFVNNFTGYCSSTKRNDNTQTGGFGLGCKTPFSVASSFMVVTTSVDDDGVKRLRHWSCHKDEEGLSAFSELVCVGVADDARCGAEIRIPANFSDTPRFVDAFHKIVRWWKIRPVSNRDGGWAFQHDVETSTPAVDWILPDVGIIAAKVSAPRVTVVLDEVEYECPWVSPHIKGWIVLKFSTGDLPVTLTRDNLDAKAEATIAARLVRVLHQVEDEVEPASLRAAVSLFSCFGVEKAFGTWDGSQTFNLQWTWGSRLLSLRMRSSERADSVAMTPIALGDKHHLVLIRGKRVPIKDVRERMGYHGAEDVTAVVVPPEDKWTEDSAGFWGTNLQSLRDWAGPFLREFNEWMGITPAQARERVAPKRREHHSRTRVWNQHGTPARHIPERALYTFTSKGCVGYHLKPSGGMVRGANLVSLGPLPDGSSPQLVSVRSPRHVLPGWTSYWEEADRQLLVLERRLQAALKWDSRTSHAVHLLRASIRSSERETHPLAHYLDEIDVWENARLCADLKCYRGLCSLLDPFRAVWIDRLPSLTVPEQVERLLERGGDRFLKDTLRTFDAETGTFSIPRTVTHPPDTVPQDATAATAAA